LRKSIAVAGDTEAFDTIEIGDEGNGQPIVPRHLVVSADDDASLAGMTKAQAIGRGGTDVIEINGRMAGGIDAAKVAVGLFEQQRRRRRAALGDRKQDPDQQRKVSIFVRSQVANGILPGTRFLRITPTSNPRNLKAIRGGSRAAYL
jgi:hypothetical protein